MSNARILTIDLETAPILSNHWKIWDETIGLEQIVSDWSILCYAAKWLGSPRMIFDYTGGRGRRWVRDDKKLMRGLWELLDEADIVIAQNGKRFDIRKINARLIQHGLGPYSPIRVIDTLQVSKRMFGFTSTKLAWVSRALQLETTKSEHKRFPGFSLWTECLKDNPAAWREMKRYNIKDVVSTEQLYLRQRPWIDNHPNLAVYSGQGQCPRCGSRNVRSNGWRVSQGSRFRRFLCLDCGGWARGRQSEKARPALMP